MGNDLSSGRREAGRWAKAVGLAALACLGAGEAFAGCGMPGAASHSPPNWHAAAAAMARHESIVGLWKVSFISDGSAYPAPIPAGAETDFGTVQWHSDGTEFMISGGRAPSTGDVCMGVWKPTGPHTVKLDHLALAWVSQDTPPPAGPVTPAAFLGPAVFHETITLGADGNSYTGPFTIDQYAADGTTLIEHIGGTVTGTRITAD